MVRDWRMFAATAAIQYTRRIEGGYSMNTTPTQLYDTDFYGWVQQQANTLRTGNLAGLDVENLIEEIESMGRNEKRELENRLRLLLIHLLKWQHQPNFRSKSWQMTIKEQRRQVAKHLRENPSLTATLTETYKETYGFAVLGAAKETGMDESVFPTECAWTFDQAMDDGFWPDA